MSLGSHPEISRVYQDGPFLWLPTEHLNVLGIKSPEAGMILKLTGPAPDCDPNPVSGHIEHVYELAGLDDPRRRWWIEHLCCFTHEFDTFVPPAPETLQEILDEWDADEEVWEEHESEDGDRV